MGDWQRQSYLARERVLKPEVFLETKQQTRYAEKFNVLPAYLSDQPQIVLKESNVILSSLSLRQQQELKLFVGDNDMELNLADDDDETKHMIYYRGLEVNGVQVRTADSEVDLKTRDSIVCGRHSSEDADDDVVDEVFYGTVCHILMYGDEPLVYVDWFRCIADTVTHDQLGGLAAIPVCKRTARTRSNGWINVSNLALQQHILVGDVSDSIFYIVIKI